MAGVPVTSASATSGNLPQQQHPQQQRRPPRHGRHQTSRRQHYSNRGAPSFGGERGGSRSSRSLPRPSWAEGAPHGAYPHDGDGPPFHSEGSRSYNKHHNNSNHQPHHNGNGKQHLPRGWWSSFSTPEQAPAVFLPRECPPCNKSPPTAWTMVEHLCSMEHCQSVLASRTAEYERTGQSGPRLLCELCRVPLLSASTARNHFFGGKHRGLVRTIKRDLRNAGCTDVPPDNTSDNRSDGGRSSKRSSSRGGSIEERDRALVADEDRGRPPADEEQEDDERRRRDPKTPNGYTQTQSLQQLQTTYPTSDVSIKDRRKQPQGTPVRDRRSLKGHEDQRRQTDDADRNECSSGNGDDNRRHQYFLSSEEEHSDEDGPVPGSNRDNDRRTGPFADDPRTPDTRPKVPLGRPLVGSAGRSLVEKRKDILLKLSNCTDVRDLTKQLRQIGRGADEKQKTARKMLPGVAYTNREIEKQETFAEARARAAMEEAITIDEAAPSAVAKHGSKKETSGNSGAGSSSSKTIKTESAPRKSTNCPTKTRIKDENNDDCTVVSAPPEPPPQTISDSEDGQEEQPPEAVPRELPSCTTVTAQPSGVRDVTPAQAPPVPQPLPSDELVRLVALASEEAACEERLIYFSQILPRVEALLGFLRQEEQKTLSHFEFIRAAKSRIVAAASQGPQPPQGADMFGPSQIINAILHPAARNPDSLAWLLNSARTQGSAAGYNLGSVLGNMGASPAPPPTPAPSIPSFLNGVTGDAVSSFLTPQLLPASTDLTRKRSNASPRSSVVSLKRLKIAETQLDEQLHSEQVLAVHLSGDFVYSSSRDGVVKRTPLNDGEGAVVIYRHCGQDSNSNLKKVCAYMIEVSVHKKLQSVKVITGSDDCALRVFDGDSGHLMKVIPVQARVLCGFIAWQKIYIGLKSGYIQVYNLVDQRFLVESEVRQVPKFVSSTQCASSKNVVVVTQDNAMMLRDAGTLFLLYAVDKRDQRITALIVKDENILLAGENKVYIFDKGGRLCREVELEENIFGAAPFRTSLLVASATGFLFAINWKALISGQVQRRGQLAWTVIPAVSAGAEATSTATSSSAASPAEVVAALHCNEASRRVAIATEAGRVAVLDVEADFGKAATASASSGANDGRSSDEEN